jgi:succinyl-diaminopimelate desuccinylase
MLTWLSCPGIAVAKGFAVCAARSRELPAQRAASHFTDAAALRLPWGKPPVVILGPGEPGMAHQTDGYCRVDRIREAALLFTDLIDDGCEAPA